MTELPDRLLRDALHDSASKTPSSMCVDADALAAWADGTMAGADRVAFEIHAAGCARCQALMAAMARTEPPPIEPAWWRRPFYSWMMPLAVATAAIIIVVFLAIPERRGPALPGPAVTETSRDASASVAPPHAEKTAPSAAAPSASPAAPPSAAGAGVPDSRRDRATTLTRNERPQDESKDAAGRPAAKSERAARDAEPAAAQPPVPAPASPLASTASAPPSAAVAGAVSPPAAARETASPGGAGGGGLGATAAAQVPAAGTRANADAARSFDARAGAEALHLKAVAANPLLIVSPVRESQWRIVNGAVEHTDDGGATWRPQALGTDVPVRAGSAPAARVCWLAGARGLVLLTTDAATWRRIGFPESVDLVAIDATDAVHATVTTADGRRFSTADGGQTWTH